MMTQEIPERLKDARKKLELNQIQIANDLDIQQKSISDIENGKIINIPNTYIYYFYKKGISLDWIYDGKEPMFIFENEEPKTQQKQIPIQEIFEEIDKMHDISAQTDKVEPFKNTDSLSNYSLFERIIESKDFNIKSLFAYIKSLENNLEFMKDLLSKNLIGSGFNKK
jgi:transcriptional regulator with XRE-family HTH domain